MGNNIEITRDGNGVHRAGHVWTLRVGGVYRGTFETKRQAIDSANSLFTADLDDTTGGYNADHFMDDEEFNWAVQQMEDLGHDRERTADAIREWIDRTPMWDCPNDECGKANLDESYTECPICETANPSVVWIDGEPINRRDA